MNMKNLLLETAIKQMTMEEQKRVKKCIREIRQIVNSDRLGVIALAVVSLEHSND